MALQRVSTGKTIGGAVRKEAAWNMISDYSAYPQYMQNVDNVTIHERSENSGRSEWFVTVEEAPLTWMELDCYDKARYELTFESIAGDFDSIKGRWKIEDTLDHGIYVEFSVAYDLGIPVIEEVLGDILQQKMKANIDSMVDAVEKQLLQGQHDERRYRRIPVQRRSRLQLNGSQLEAVVIDISCGGVLLSSNPGFERCPRIFSVAGFDLEVQGYRHDTHSGTTALTFGRPLGEKAFHHILRTLAAEQPVASAAGGDTSTAYILTRQPHSVESA